MTKPTDPASEIKLALDREVARRFDPGRVAAAFERGGRDRSAGPLSRVPVPVQWLGVAAAVIAAVTGIRTVYLDLAERQSRAPLESGARAIEPRKEAPEPRQEAPEPPAPVDTAEPAPPEKPILATKPADEGPITPPEPEDPGLLAERTAALASPPSPTGRGLRTPPARTAPPVRDVAVVEPGPRAAPSEPGARPTPSPAPVRAFFPGTPDVSVGGVRLASLGGPGLVASLIEVPEIGATLVTIRGHAGGASGRRVVPVGPSPPSRASGEEPDRDGQVGFYYARVLYGSAFELLAEEAHGLFGKGFRVVPLRELEAWGSDGEAAFLQGTFDLRSVVATDGARVEPGNDAGFVASVGGRLFAISLRAEPTGRDGGHEMQVRIARDASRGSRQPSRGEVAATLVAGNGRVILIGIPDALLTGEGPTGAGSDTVFLAVSPRFEELAPPPGLEKRLLVERPSEPPILIDGPEPDYPERAAELGIEGQVVAGAVVREDGSVGGVQILSLPDVPGAAHLVDAAAGAVRRWRYLPARHHGRPVSTYVTIALEVRAR